jgi:hypothetical protein
MLPDGTLLKGISDPADKGEMQLKTEKIEKPVLLDLADVKTIYIKPAPTVRFNVRVNAGINVSKGNTDSETYHFDGEAVARTQKNRYTLEAYLIRNMPIKIKRQTIPSAI